MPPFFQRQYVSSSLLVVASFFVLFPIKEQFPLQDKKSGFWQTEYAGYSSSVDLWLSIPMTAATGLIADRVGISGGSSKVPLRVLACGVPMRMVAVVTSSAMPLAVAAVAGGLTRGTFLIITEPRNLKRFFAFITMAVTVFMGLSACLYMSFKKLSLKKDKEKYIMIAQKQKPVEEILEYLNGKQEIVLIGCGGCATVFHTGGEPEVREMADTLSKGGKNVLAAITLPLGEFTCYLPWSKKRIVPYRKQIEDCDAILMLTCGDGLQVVREHILEDEFGINKPMYPGTNPLGHMGGGPTLFKEKCMQCGDCELGRYAGICPLTQCSKGLLNGPCGGSQNGKCEVDPNRDCAWKLILDRLEEFGELDRFIKEKPRVKDYSKMSRPRTIEVSPLNIE